MCTRLDKLLNEMTESKVYGLQMNDAKTDGESDKRLKINKEKIS